MNTNPQEPISTEAKNRNEYRATAGQFPNQLHQYEAIINSVSDAIITTGFDYTIKSWNKAAEKIYGWTEREVVGKNIDAVIPPTFIEDSIENVLDSFQNHGTWRGEVIQKTKDNQPLYIDASINLVLDHNKEPLEVVAINRDITDYKKFALALLESEKKARALINAVNDALFLVQTDGTIVLANNELAARFGLTGDALIGRNVFELFPREAAQRRKDFAKIVLGRGEMMSFANQQWGRAYDTQIFPLKNDDGQVTHFAIFSHDITEQNKIKQALIESEDRFRTVLETVQLIGLMLNHKGQLTFCNDYLLNLTKWTREEVLGKSWFDYFLPDFARDTVKNVFAETIKSDNFPPHYENEIVTKDGEIRLISWHNTTYRDENGRVSSITSIGQDITEQRQKENELRRLNRAIEQSPVSVVITDLDGKIEYVNPKFSTVTGYTAAEAIGQNPRILKSGEHDQAFYENLWATITSGQTWQGELHNKRKNGELFWEATTIAPIFSQNGRISSYVAVKEDITEEKKLEVQLRQQERLAAVGQLAAGVAHDFNNIMTVIQLYGELLEKSPLLPEKLAPKVETIINQSKRATELIEQILDFSNQSILKREPFDLLLLVQEMIGFLTRTLPSDIELSLHHNEPHYPVHADKTRMQQVLMNLCVNARDAMPNGGKLVLSLHSLTVLPDDPAEPHHLTPGEWIELKVQDSGTGIKKEILPHIFEPFFTTKGSGIGNGLGLAQVYGIVKQHEGEIAVQSRHNEGALFTIFLPRFHHNDGALEKKAQPKLRKGNGELILIVEDDPFTRQSLVETVAHLGYAPVAAENGRIALNILAQNQAIKLILSDVVMPEMGGIDLLHALNKQKNRIPIILITGHLLNHKQDLTTLTGLHSFLTKPPKLEELATAIASGIKQ